MHNLDTTAGVTSFVSANEQAWHTLGTVLPGRFTAEEAMKHAYLGRWDVRKWPAFAVDPKTGALVPKPGRVDIVRTNPVKRKQVDWLGEGSEGYTIVQNEAHAEFLNNLVEQSGAHFETAGAIDGGRKVFITMKLPGYMSIGGVDRVDLYIVAINSHDGTLGFTFLITPIRVVCQNTLNLAFSEAVASFRVRHTSGATAMMGHRAREALDLTFNYLDGFQQTAERLLDKTLVQQRFEEIIAANYGPEEGASKATITRADRRLDKMAELFAESATQEGIRFTAWAGLNAITEYADHFSPARGDDPDISRARRAVLDPSFKNEALQLMLAVK
jgi:phage/plasmid-like protein (TIGR03299 family)